MTTKGATIVATRNVTEYLMHSPDCAAGPDRIEAYDVEGLPVASCLGCGAHFPPSDPHGVSGGMAGDVDPGVRHAAHVAQAEHRLASAGGA